jgi:hypothetical protein
VLILIQSFNTKSRILRHAQAWLWVLLLILFGTFSPRLAHATPTQLGDLDDDGVFTANDLAMLVGHSSGTTPLLSNLQPFADLTLDGFINDADQAALVSLILETTTPQNLPLASIREVSPASGEGDVAVTRETVLHFSMPLALNASIDTSKLFAEFGGRKILSRVELSSDRKKATLFYLEPLPSNARIRVSFDSTGVNDLLNRAIDGDGDGQAGGSYITSFDTLSITAVAGTAISGRVFASERGTGGNEVPLAGVTVTVDGAEQTLRTTTDAQGNFTLSPCPAGSFFVHIDGRTSPQSAWPGGDYYPNVGKRWEALAGRTDNLSGNPEDTSRGTIYLPKVLGAALQTVSQTQETEVEFPPAVLATNPALAGTELIVPANSLFADDGTRGGRVGIAPVSPDRLPSPLPPGLNLPIVITIQTDGATNFDRPVPICFPNLPDPVTGEKLPPGAKSALWSFNHDLGDWEVIGPMTVTEDGNFVKTDAGVGVRQPGWHGTQPGTPGDGGEEDKDPPPDDDDEPLEISVQSATRQQDGKVMMTGDSIVIVSNKSTTQWNVAQARGQTTNVSSGTQIEIKGVQESQVLDDVVVIANYTGKHGPETKTHALTVLGPLEIAVDRNRDGIVEFGGGDQTASNSRHLFWTNNDRDSVTVKRAGDIEGSNGSSFINGSNGRIDGLNDLEDLDRLVLRGKPVLTALLSKGYKLRMRFRGPSSNMIGITLTAAEDASLNYLNNAAKAEQQVDMSFVGNTADITRDIASAGYGVNVTTRFGQPTVTFLYEGRKDGSLDVSFEITAPGCEVAASESNVLYLSLRKTAALYDIYSPVTSTGHGDNTDTPYHQITSTSTQRQNWDSSTASSPMFSAPEQYLLFVHGWRQKPEERRDFAETAFKRLFWSGYRGRVGLFSWPTDYAAKWHLPLYQKNYDRSERRAYHSAPALRSLLGMINANFRQTCLIAHSMGNCVASEALRIQSESSTQPIVDLYIATQAATVAHAYDPSVPRITDTEIRSLIGAGAGLENPEIPNVYAGFGIRNGTNPYFRSIGSGAGRIVNFFNRQDDALDKWLINQFTKPDIPDVQGDDSILGAVSGLYGFDAAVGQFYRKILKPGPIEETVWLNEVSDRYEVFSHIAETRSRALGAQPTSLGPVATNINLELSSLGAFGSGEFDHSGQFNRPFVRSQHYWREVIRQAGF